MTDLLTLLFEQHQDMCDDVQAGLDVPERLFRDARDAISLTARAAAESLVIA